MRQSELVVLTLAVCLLLSSTEARALDNADNTLEDAEHNLPPTLQETALSQLSNADKFLGSYFVYSAMSHSWVDKMEESESATVTVGDRDRVFMYNLLTDKGALRGWRKTAIRMMGMAVTELFATLHGGHDKAFLDFQVLVANFLHFMKAGTEKKVSPATALMTTKLKWANAHCKKLNTTSGHLLSASSENILATCKEWAELGGEVAFGLRYWRHWLFCAEPLDDLKESNENPSKAKQRWNKLSGPFSKAQQAMKKAWRACGDKKHETLKEVEAKLAAETLVARVEDILRHYNISENVCTRVSNGFRWHQMHSEAVYAKKEARAELAKSSVILITSAVALGAQIASGVVSGGGTLAVQALVLGTRGVDIARIIGASIASSALKGDLSRSTVRNALIEAFITKLAPESPVVQDIRPEAPRVEPTPFITCKERLMGVLKLLSFALQPKPTLTEVQQKHMKLLEDIALAAQGTGHTWVKENMNKINEVLPSAKFFAAAAEAMNG